MSRCRRFLKQKLELSKLFSEANTPKPVEALNSISDILNTDINDWVDHVDGRVEMCCAKAH